MDAVVDKSTDLIHEQAMLADATLAVRLAADRVLHHPGSRIRQRPTSARLLTTCASS